VVADSSNLHDDGNRALNVDTRAFVWCSHRRMNRSFYVRLLSLYIVVGCVRALRAVDASRTSHILECHPITGFAAITPLRVGEFDSKTYEILSAPLKLQP